MKKIVLTLITFLLPGFFCSFAGEKRKYIIKTIVIDPGHGGHDTGCLGSSSKEKDIALDISLKLGKLIHEHYPDVKVVYTRKTDVFVELHERAEIANQHKADLFICIHANSGGSAIGTETFVLGLHRAEENLAVSRRENSAILMEKDYKTNYEGFDPNSAEANIIFRLYQNTYLQQSLLFAAKVQDQLNYYAGRVNRGVKQAGLLVLARTSMPGVLIETGFLTNKSEEKYLLSSKGQTMIATSIYRAFKEYKIDMEESPDGGKTEVQHRDTMIKPETRPVKDKDTGTVAEQSAVIPDKKIQPPPKSKEVIVNVPPPPDTTKTVKAGPATQAANTSTEKQKKTVPDTAKPGSDSIGKPVATAQKDKPEIRQKNTEPVKPAVEKLKTETVPTDEVIFTIQLAATANPTTRDRDRFKNITGIDERKGEDGMTRFTKGKYVSLEKAISGQNEMRAAGFKDAFVTAYIKDKRITIKEAQVLVKSPK